MYYEVFCKSAFGGFANPLEPALVFKRECYQELLGAIQYPLLNQGVVEMAKGPWNCWLDGLPIVGLGVLFSALEVWSLRFGSPGWFHPW